MHSCMAGCMAVFKGLDPHTPKPPHEEQETHGLCESSLHNLVLPTLKTINGIDEYTKFNTILRPKNPAKAASPKDIDILGFDMEWESSTNEVISSQLAWFGDGKVKTGVFEARPNADLLLRLVEGCLG